MRGPPVILRTLAKVLVMLLPVLAFFLLVRGHDSPGGGFIAAMVAVVSITLLAVAYGPRRSRRLLGVGPRSLIAGGMALAIASGLPGLLVGGAFLEGHWVGVRLVGVGTVQLGTPLMFDLGVFLTVMGGAAAIMLALEEEAEWR